MYYVMYLYTFQVFSDVYAVLDKNWKESHHDRLCEILANVEHECEVQISFVNGAYRFRGTLQTLYNVSKSLGRESDSNRILSKSSDDTQQVEEQLSGEPSDENLDPRAVEVNSDSVVILAELESCNEEKQARASNTLPGREHAVVDNAVRTSTNEEETVNEKTQPETEQVEQADNLPPSTSTDHVSEEETVNQKTQHETEQVEQADNQPPSTSTDHVISNQLATSLHSLQVSESSVCGPVKAAMHAEDHHNDTSKCLDQHCDMNALPQTGPSPSLPCDTKKSLQAEENHQALDKNSGTNHVTADAPDKPDNQQLTTFDETESTKMAKHEDRELETSRASSPLHRAVEASTDTRNPPGPGLSKSAATPRLTSHEDNSKKQLRELMYARDLTSCSTNEEQTGGEASHISIPLCQSVGASADKHTNDPQRGTDVSVVNKSSNERRLAARTVDTITSKDLIYARRPTDSATS